MQDFLTGRMPNPSISVKVLKEYDTKERKKTSKFVNLYTKYCWTLSCTLTHDASLLNAIDMLLQFTVIESSPTRQMASEYADAGLASRRQTGGVQQSLCAVNDRPNQTDLAETCAS